MRRLSMACLLASACGCGAADGATARDFVIHTDAAYLSPFVGATSVLPMAWPANPIMVHRSATLTFTVDASGLRFIGPPVVELEVSDANPLSGGGPTFNFSPPFASGDLTWPYSFRQQAPCASRCTFTVGVTCMTTGVTNDVEIWINWQDRPDLSGSRRSVRPNLRINCQP